MIAENIRTAIADNDTTTIITHINMCLMYMRSFGLEDMTQYISWNMGYLTIDERTAFAFEVCNMHEAGYFSING